MRQSARFGNCMWSLLTTNIMEIMAEISVLHGKLQKAASRTALAFQTKHEYALSDLRAIAGILPALRSF